LLEPYGYSIKSDWPLSVILLISGYLFFRLVLAAWVMNRNRAAGHQSADAHRSADGTEKEEHK
jgi:hypothetical protein